MKPHFASTFLEWLTRHLFTIEYEPFRYSISASTLEPRSFRVEIENLKVWLYRRDEKWIAQGLDIAYTATGQTPEQARARFEQGLARTVVLSMQKSGSLESLIRPAPPNVWTDWRMAYVRRHVSRAKPPAAKQPVTQDFAPPPRLSFEYFQPPLGLATR
jgi:hypothetical protein